MTQAFNLAQLANNLNTSGQLDATDGLTGLVANSNLASSGTASASTYLRGDRTWGSVAQNVVAYRASVTTQQETRSNSQGASFLISSSAYMSGLTAITHTCASASNYVLLKLVMPVGGNATGDGSAVAFSVDGTCPGGGALASSNTTGSETRDNVQVLHTIVYPNDTSSHVYRVNWCSAINGASQTCNSMVRTSLGTQTLFELWEVSPTGIDGSVYTV